jgi:2-polyprenyl-6-methoxyphenol hydroxylase-like FAD-dependent oxidoreductase
MDTDVIIAGAGPAGLMLAAELCLAGVRPLVLERQPQLREAPRASGFSGQITELLRYRGLMDQVMAAAGPASVRPAAPFGGVDLDFSHLADPPIRGLHLPQPRLERLLAGHAGGLGAEIRRGHEVIAVSQDDAEAAADVRGPGGAYRVSARFLVGCDGARSRVRELAGIAFPGITYPEVNRLCQGTLSDAVTVLGNGDIDVPGLGTVRQGFTRTGGGVFAFGRQAAGRVMIQTTEDESTAVDDDVPMSLAEFAGSVRRVLGAELPLAEVTRLSRYGFQARQAERYRAGRILVAGDAAHQFPATGIGISTGMMDAVNLAWKLAASVHGWAPPGLLGTYQDERHFAGARGMLQTQAQVALRRGRDPAADALRTLFLELMAYEQPLRHMGELIAGSGFRYPLPDPGSHPLAGTFAPDLPLRTGDGKTTSVAELMRAARPVFLDLAGRSDLLEAARPWEGRVDIRAATTDDRPADALLIRPDACIAWAATACQPAGAVAPVLPEALFRWFGAPLDETVPVTGWSS